MTKKDTTVTPKVTKYATIILDTSTEAELILRQSVLEEIQAASTKNREKLAPNEYTLRNLRMSALFDQSKNNGLNLVTIQYMKEKWTKVGENRFENTGELIMDGWHKTNGEADIAFEMEAKTIAGKTIMISNLTKNRFSKEQTHEAMKDMTYDDLMATFLDDYDDDELLPNVAVSLTGEPKTGKTHLAMTFPDPIKVYCFNGGADFVKRRFKGKHIDIINFRMPIIDTLTPEAWAAPIWAAFYKDFKKTVEESK